MGERMPSVATIVDPIELHLLVELPGPVFSERLVRAGIASILLHIAGVIVLLSVPDFSSAPLPPVAAPDLRKAVHIVAPRFYEPTQKAPNQGKVKRELDVRSTVQVPQAVARQFRLPPPPAPTNQPQAQTPDPLPTIEPPKIEILAAAPPPITITGTTPQVAPPPPQPKPKIAFESVGTGARSTPDPHAQIQAPKNSIQDAMRGATKPGAGGITVGDLGDEFNSIPSLNQTQSPARVGSNLQLLSDPLGADFKPYLIQVLTLVRRNWLAIIPESAHMGRQGRVQIQFIIDRSGGVPKLVIAEASGTEAFDRAAVAGISASYPFPRLPADYKGEEVRLQLSFSYNVPNR
jgi:TonB family protein